jgi:TonB-linked SusC/RagA family outer membrane protein
MKLTIVLWVAALLQVSAATYAQKVSLNVKNATLDDVLTNLSEQSGYNFIYNTSMMKASKPVNLTISNELLTEALDVCFKDQPLTYVINGNTVVIKKKIAPVVAPVTAPEPVVKPPVVITGTVVDQKGLPLPGVSVSLKGSTVGVATGIDGKYSLKLPDDNGVLLISFLGYIPQEIPVSGKSIINVTLEERPSALNEVVVVGYGTQQRKDLLSAVSTVKGSEIQNLPTATPQSLIQGRASGIQVVQNSGQPGSAATVRIRGTTSINAGNDPLYIIDGVPVESGTLTGITHSGAQTSALAAIDADDIESMDVLKDAGALAIYGSRAANGVVLITTKHGKKGITNYSFNYYRGWQADDKSRRVKLMDNQQAIDLIQDGRSNALIDGGVAALYGFLLPAPDGTVANTDWQSPLLRTAPISNYEMSIRGGEEKLRFAISGSYLDQQGIIIASGFKRGSARVNLDYDASSKLKIGTNLSFSRYNNQRVATEDGGVLQVALKKSPSLPIYNADGSFYQGDVSGFINPVAFANKVQDNNQVSSAIGNIYGQYNFIHDLSLRTSAGVDYASVLDTYFQPSDAVRNGVAAGDNFSSTVDSWIIENTLNYNHTFNKLHHLTGLLGYSQQERSSYGIRAAGSQYATNNIATLNAAVMPTTATSSNSAYGLSSAFARITYAYNEKYYLEGSVRRDGSSRFGADKRYAIFPAVSGAWRVSNEQFWQKDKNIINDLKIRASIGRTGNQSIDDYVAQGQYSTGGSYIGQSGIYLSTIPNPNLTWETTLQYDAGLDISLFNSRISLGIDVYVKNTSNLLLNVPIPHTTGFSSILENVGATQNKGLEFNLNTTNIQRNDFTWSTNLNVSFNRNVVTQLYSGANNIIYTTGSGATGSLQSFSILQPGSPIGSMYGWVKSGVYRYSTDNTAKVTNASLGTNGYQFKGGDLIFQDTNGSGTIDNNDRVIIGNAQPKFTGGMTNTVKYKSFDLSVLMTFSYGNNIINGTKYSAESGSGFEGDLTLLNRWRNEGDITEVPRQDYADPAGNRRFSNRWVEDGSYLRCKNLTLGYTFSKALLDKISVKNLRIYATGQNVFTLTKYTGYDPEASSFNGNVTNIGIDEGTYPQYRALILGLTLGF